MGGGELGFSGPFFAYFRATADIITVLAFLAAAVLLAIRRSRSWLILFLSMTLVFSGVNYTDAFYGLYKPTSSITVFVGIASALAEICQLAAFFIFPDGHLTPRWLGRLLVIWIPYRLIAWTVCYP